MEFLSSLYQSLQALVVDNSGVTVAHGDAAGQDALNQAAV